MSELTEFPRAARPASSEHITLTHLANLAGSDKGTTHFQPHSYTLLYDLLLYHRRDTVRNMLEIGLCAGGPEVGGTADRQAHDAPSVRMWLRYFPNASIYGFDISDFSFVQDPRFQFIRGDSGKQEDLQRAAEAVDAFDLVIDDGSHASFHQQLAFKVLFPKLAPGGIYIIEDLHWQSPYYEGELPSTVKTADLFQHWYRTGSFPPVQAEELAGLEDLAREISFSFVLTQPFTDKTDAKIAVIQKKFEPVQPVL